MAKLDYKEHLALLYSETLELRRLKIDLISVYTILFGLLDIDFNDYFAFKPDWATRCSSGHNCCPVESNGRVSMGDVIIAPLGTLSHGIHFRQQLLKLTV